MSEQYNVDEQHNNDNDVLHFLTESASLVKRDESTGINLVTHDVTRTKIITLQQDINI